MRRIFYTQVEGVTVAADRADVLALVTGAELDEQLLAARLLMPQPAAPLARECLWRGIHHLPGDHWLMIDHHGAARFRRWWSPPEPEMPIAAGAAAVRDALAAAVDARVSAGGTVSSDLSGGLDSTSLCFLAAQSEARLITITKHWDEPGNEDMVFADRAARHLPGVERLVLDATQLPMMFDDVAEVGAPLDEPYFGVHDRARYVAIMRELATRGSRLHMSGVGGDEIVQAPASYLNDTMRRHPWMALMHARGFRARQRWPASTTLRGLMNRQSYRSWLADSADELSGKFVGAPLPGAWWYPVRMPPWATPDATLTARSVLRTRAEFAEPLATQRGQHAALGAALNTASGAAQAERILSRAGVPISFPYLDDRVVEACLAVRLHERTTPSAYKPVLKRAMSGLVPAEVLTRNTKDSCGTEWFRGIRQRRTELAALCDQSLLAERGLIDPGMFRAACLDPAPASTPLAAIEWTLACERWLQEVTRMSAQTPEMETP
ncbi:hypothetical protein AWN90_32295 [Nocardia terpenica]|uniref:asparagine synthase (glutamine-hydrolyzing) n=1 Tax=Nocardia terpenica TaxID=455432 RepID=A0A164MGJ9_9NOCA|nr:hypothetical protein AWN90_32295 [Nocardia terpenica]